jgi:hypothetical protein
MLIRHALARASRKQPCPVCGKPDWCSLSRDGTIAICMRRPSAHATQNGGYLHQLAAPSAPPRRPVAPSSSPATAAPRADADHIDTVYGAMLCEQLQLCDAHREKLLARGLTPAEIAARGYASTPGREEAAQLTETLAHLDLRGVPGFYRERGQWRMVNAAPGYFVPYRDERGRVAAMQYRLDEPLNGGQTKYLWFSSPPERYPEGTSSGAPVHVSRPELLPEAREVTLTEGALKADVASFFLKAPVIAAAGVTLFERHIGDRLRHLAPQLHTVYVAFDLDWKSNEAVKRALFRVLEELERARFAARLRAWPPHMGKGIDDYLLTAARGGDAA